ncbi:MAG: DUF1302 domain-containing protein [Paracoccaceae bacterium]|nr:DUF1302 domain-containing protein [Paracoccaceae bacterium]
MAIGLCFVAAPVSAVEFGDETVYGSLDTTISYGVTLRAEKRDESIGGPNSDDGNRTFSSGIVSNTARITTELDLDAGTLGLFARASGFFDAEVDRSERKASMSALSHDLAGGDFDILDLYLTASFDVGESLVDARIGSHVLNWGESTFIQNGINVINPFDVTALRTPGSELRQALLPVPMASVAVSPNDRMTFEGFYQLRWQKTRIDPAGTYFSTNDYGTPGGSRAFLTINDSITDKGFGFGPLTSALNHDLANAPIPDSLAAFEPHFMSVSRSADREPEDSGQWGLAFRYLSETLNDTELGFYFINHHSRLPVASAIFGTPTGYQRGLVAAGAVSAPTSATVAAVTNDATTKTTQVFAERIEAEVRAMVPTGTPDSIIQQQVRAKLASPDIRQAIGARVNDAVSETIAGIASFLAIDRYGKSANYFMEYPEDLRVIGLSFNTLLGSTGLALQGEYSLHPNSPLQREEQSIFAEGLAPVVAALTQHPSAAALRSRLSTYLKGYVERDVSQLQVTATLVSGPALGADSVTMIGEAAVHHVHDMPDPTVSPLETSGFGGDVADETSWGYRAAMLLDYTNALGPATLTPYVQVQHDVSGNSPAPGGPFLEGRFVTTVGLGINYLERWQGNLSYTAHSGKSNHLKDRDFLSASIKFSF